MTCRPALERVYNHLGYSRAAPRGLDAALYPPARCPEEWARCVAAVLTHLNRANGEECCAKLRKPCAVCAAHSTVAAAASVLLHHCETPGALFEVKLRANSRTRPLLWAVTEGDGREAWRRLVDLSAEDQREAWMRNARAPRPTRFDVEQAALSALLTGEVFCKRCFKWTGDPRREHFHDGNDLTELQPTKYARIRGPDHLSSLRQPAAVCPVCESQSGRAGVCETVSRGTGGGAGTAVQ